MKLSPVNRDRSIRFPLSTNLFADISVGIRKVMSAKSFGPFALRTWQVWASPKSNYKSYVGRFRFSASQDSKAFLMKCVKNDRIYLKEIENEFQQTAV